MNKRTVLVLSTAMMSIATAACAFCVAQTANAAEKSVATVESAVSTTQSLTTPPPVANSKFTNTGASNESSLKTEDSSKKSGDSGISENGGSKIAESTNDSTKPEVSPKAGTEAKNEAETKTEPTEKNGVKSETSNTNNQMFLASTGKPVVNKPNPKPQQQQEKTELTVSLCWETMNKDNKNALINGNSDFGQLNFESWDFGSTLDASRQDVKDAFSKIKFQIKDTTDNKIVATTTGTYDSNNATSATKSLGSYDSSHTYEVSVVNSTIPSPYYVTYNNVAVGEDDSFTPDATYFTWTPKGSDKKSQNKYFRLNAMEIVYAKDESVADKCFSYEQPQNVDKSYRSDGNWKFTYNSDNIFKRVRVEDNAIKIPKDKDGNFIHPVKAGFKFVGWQFYVARKTNKRPYTSYDRMDDDDGTIIKNATTMYSPFNAQTTTYPYLFAVLRDKKGVNTFGSKLGTQYCTTNHTFVVFPKWVEAGYKVTFINEGNEYAQVKVQENKSINSDEWTAESMPTDPSKPGFTFNGWFMKQDGKGDKFTGDTPVSGNISVYSSYTSKPPTPPTPPAPTPEPEPEPTPEPEPDIDWDDIPDIDLTPDKEPEPTPVPDFPVPVAPAPILPPAEVEPEPAPAPAQPKQPEPKHAAKHLPKTGSTATPILASAIASLFAGLAGLAESFAANRKRRN